KWIQCLLSLLLGFEAGRFVIDDIGGGLLDNFIAHSGVGHRHFNAILAFGKRRFRCFFLTTGRQRQCGDKWQGRKSGELFDTSNIHLYSPCCGLSWSLSVVPLLQAFDRKKRRLESGSWIGSGLPNHRTRHNRAPWSAPPVHDAVASR